MQFTQFTRFGNTSKSRIDFLIYAPHPSINQNYISHVRTTSSQDLSHISDEIFSQFLFHEADTGVMEVTQALMKYFQDSPYSFAFLFVDIPRAFCDLNRPIELATPKILKHIFWENIYKQATQEIEKIFAQSDFIFQFHSMNSFNPIFKKSFDEAISENNLESIYKQMYSGTPRNCTILTEDDKFQYITNRNFDIIFQKFFAKNSIILEENTAYRLMQNFPCNDICNHFSSSFFELIKGSIATDETKDCINTNEIIFDNNKIEKFAKIFSEIIEEYLQNFSKKL